ncbi:MAG: FtsW/RodA/SpoVE family cell cycle protein [Minisyncoccales bacterium]
MVKTDYYLLTIVILIVLLGFFSFYSISLPLSLKNENRENYFFRHQIFYGYLPGLFFLLFFYHLKISFLKKISFFLFFSSLLLNIILFLPPFSKKVGGAIRWLKINENLSFQPFEITKPFIFLFFAKVLSEKKMNEKKEIFHFLKALFFLFLFLIVLFFQSNASNIFLISLSFFLLCFINKIKTKYLLFSILFFLIIFLILIKTSPYRQNRILNFLNPDKNYFGIGYQINQSLMAIGSGRILGEGFGMSNYKFFELLPKMIFDAPFAIFAQETGFLGSSFLIILFLLFFIRCVKIAKEMEDNFLKLLIWGINFWFIIQFLMNVGSMIQLIPVSGLPLPFFSYGGSALIGQMIALGLLFNASKKT